VRERPHSSSLRLSARQIPGCLNGYQQMGYSVIPAGTNDRVLPFTENGTLARGVGAIAGIAQHRRHRTRSR
jgi:hypothetical protein